MALIAAVLPLLASVQEAPKELDARLDAILKPMVGTKSPGVVAIVQQGGSTLYRKAHGTAEIGGSRRLTPAMPMRIASLTKAFTAATIQGLATEGKLSLDDPLTNFFPEVPAWKAVTVRHALNMVSGLPEYTDSKALGLRMTKAGGPDDVLKWATDRPLNFAPGTEFEYSNTNYVLLGLIAERAGGAPLEKLLQERIFGPLKMATATLPRRGTATPDVPEGTTLRKGKLASPARQELGWPYAAGALVMSADDLARWLAAIADARILTEAQRAEAFTPAKLVNGELSFYGYGWVLGTRGTAPMISHGGGIAGFASYVAYLPATDTRLVILANSDAADVWTLAPAILDAVEGKTVAPTIEDRDPKLTARLRTVVERMLKGERDAAEFAPGFLKAVGDEVYAQTGASFAALGPLSDFALVRDAKEGATHVREYRMRLGDAALTAVFALSADGKIASFRLR